MKSLSCPICSRGEFVRRDGFPLHLLTHVTRVGHSATNNFIKATSTGQGRTENVTKAPATGHSVSENVIKLSAAGHSGPENEKTGQRGTGNGNRTTRSGQRGSENDKRTTTVETDTKQNTRCQRCGENVANLSQLRRHRSCVFLPAGFPCSICGKRFDKKRNLQSHTFNHRHPTRYACQQCPKAFPQHNQLRSHINIHHATEPKEACAFCDKLFFDRGVLSYHIKMVHQEKAFVCDICGDKFVHKARLTLHMTTHSTERPFSCNFCNDMSFKTKWLLVRHLKEVHSGPRLHCALCGEGFKRRLVLRKHMEKQHGISDWKGDGNHDHDPSAVPMKQPGVIRQSSPPTIGNGEAVVSRQCADRLTNIVSPNGGRIPKKAAFLSSHNGEKLIEKRKITKALNKSSDSAPNKAQIAIEQLTYEPSGIGENHIQTSVSSPGVVSYVTVYVIDDVILPIAYPQTDS